MDQDIKKLKSDEEREVLEEEVKDVKTGRLKVEEMVSIEPVGVAEVKEEVAKAQEEAPKETHGRFREGRGRGGQAKGGRRGHREKDGVADEFEQKIIDLARVTRVMAGGKRMRFRACVAIGDRKGRVAIGLAKGKDVTMAIAKAVTKAKKSIVTVPITRETIPYEIREKFKAGRILLKPAKKGKGIIAGGAVRVILELSGIPNVVAKILGTNNKVTNVKATIKALKKFEDSKLVKKSTKDKKEDKANINKETKTDKK